MGDGPRYFRVSPRFWDDAASWSDDAKLLALYILTCHHRTSEGLFRLPKAYAREDMEWSQERFEEGFRELLEVGFIDYDEAARVVLIRKALKYQAPANENIAKAAVAKLEELPETRLWHEFRQLAERYAEQLDKQLRERFGELTPDPQALALTQSQTHPPASADDAADHGSLNVHGPEPHGVNAINGNDSIPREPEPGMTYAQTLAAWLEGKGRRISPRDKVSDEYRALLDTTCEFIGDRTHLTASVAEKLVRDLSVRLTDEDLPDDELSRLRKALRNRKPVGGVLSVVATAMENDAGKGEYANKPGALMRYALACLDGRGSRKAAS